MTTPETMTPRRILRPARNASKVYEEILDLVRLTTDPSTWEPFDAAAERMFAEQRAALLAIEEDSERDARDADAFLLRIAQEPVSNWQAIIGQNPHVCTSALAQRLIDLSTPELDRNNPSHALLLLQVAELVAYTLPERASIRYRGYVWKQRSNALRRLAEYERQSTPPFSPKDCSPSLTD